MAENLDDRTLETDDADWPYRLLMDSLGVRANCQTNQVVITQPRLGESEAIITFNFSQIRSVIQALEEIDKYYGYHFGD